MLGTQLRFGRTAISFSCYILIWSLAGRQIRSGSFQGRTACFFSESQRTMDEGAVFYFLKSMLSHVVIKRKLSPGLSVAHKAGIVWLTSLVFSQNYLYFIFNLKLSSHNLTLGIIYVTCVH